MAMKDGLCSRITKKTRSPRWGKVMKGNPLPLAHITPIDASFGAWRDSMIKQLDRPNRRQPIDQVCRALDELAELIIEVASDERKLSTVVAKLTEMDMKELGFSMRAPTNVLDRVGLYRD